MGEKVSVVTSEYAVTDNVKRAVVIDPESGEEYDVEFNNEKIVKWNRRGEKHESKD